jgi:thioredoxin reductase (NADPH)
VTTTGGVPSAGPGQVRPADLPKSPTLAPDAIAEVASYAEERPIAAGQILARAGDESYDFAVLLDGEVDIVRPDNEGEVLIAHHGPGAFLGELGLITGQRLFLTARVTRGGRALFVPPEAFRRLMAGRPGLADTVFQALVARQMRLKTGEGARALRLVGSRYSAEAMALRAYVTRTRLPHTWIDVEDAADPDVLLAGLGLRPVDMPAVLTSTVVLRRPSPGELASYLGLTYRPTPGYTFDLVVVGTGPAGLAASVYGASEGLGTVSLDATAAGGQAGTSSRIENYVGFPNGVSGGDLTALAAIQAQRLGARLNAPCEVVKLRSQHGFHVVVLSDGSEIPCRSVIVASGARYRRLGVAGLDRFEGAGVYYAATDLEGRLCAGQPVVIVGGGNSAGQAAIYLAQQGCRVSIAIRRRDLAETMSRYLIARIEVDPRIEVLTGTEVRALEGDRHLTGVTLEHGGSGPRRTVGCAGLFCFIGAIPATSWLGGLVALDRAGFVLTDRSLPDEVAHGPAFAGRAPLPFETSVPGVFAVGDVRSGSMKRVAAAVGEGSSAVRSVHEHLATAG